MAITNIKYIDYYIPNDRLSLENLYKEVKKKGFILESKKEFLEYRKENMHLTGVNVENTLKDFEMLDHILGKMFLSIDIKPEMIDAILFAQESFNYQTMNLAQRAQHVFHMKKACVINVTGNHCNNVEVSIKIAEGLFLSNLNFNNILIISTQKLHCNEERIIGKTAILGDAAGLLLLSREANAISVIDSKIINNGYFHNLNESPSCSLLHYKYASQLMSFVFREWLLTDHCICNVIIQNINYRAILQYFNPLDFDKNKVFLHNCGKYGHMTGIDFIINLKDCLNLNGLEHGKYFLTFGMGWAGSYVSSLIGRPNKK